MNLWRVFPDRYIRHTSEPIMLNTQSNVQSIIQDTQSNRQSIILDVSETTIILDTQANEWWIILDTEVNRQWIILDTSKYTVTYSYFICLAHNMHKQSPLFSFHKIRLKHFVVICYLNCGLFYNNPKTYTCARTMKNYTTTIMIFSQRISHLKFVLKSILIYLTSYLKIKPHA